MLEGPYNRRVALKIHHQSSKATDLVETSPKLTNILTTHLEHSLIDSSVQSESTLLQKLTGRQVCFKGHT